jgi:hypothetical protein
MKNGRLLAMNKIPTAEEFLKDKVYITKDDIKDVHDSLITVTNTMIEFAKLHVEAAIEECIECAPSGSSTDTVSYKDVVQALKDCYPLDNVK